MLTRRIDAALFSMQSCRERVPFLRDCHRLGSKQRAALDDLLASLKTADEALSDFSAEAQADRG